MHTDRVVTPRRISLRWSNADETGVQSANQFALGFDLPVGEEGRPDGLVLTVGRATVPLVTGTPEEIEAQAANIASIPVVTLARFSVSVARARELRDLLERVLSAHDKQATQGKDEAT